MTERIPTCPRNETPKSGRVSRYMLAMLGVIAVGLGFIGAFVPGMPTVVFLLIASYLFTRSCPWLEERLIRVKVFKPYLKYLDGKHGMPKNAKISALVLMWVSIGVSLTVMASSGNLSKVFLGVILALGVIGTVAIIRVRTADPHRP